MIMMIVAIAILLVAVGLVYFGSRQSKHKHVHH